jgi:hypothetical protein
MKAVCLFQFPIDLVQFDRREQLKKSGLGKVCIYVVHSDIIIVLQIVSIFVTALSNAAYLGYHVFVQI